MRCWSASGRARARRGPCSNTSCPPLRGWGPGVSRWPLSPSGRPCLFLGLQALRCPASVDALTCHFAHLEGRGQLAERCGLPDLSVVCAFGSQHLHAWQSLASAEAPCGVSNMMKSFRKLCSTPCLKPLWKPRASAPVIRCCDGGACACDSGPRLLHSHGGITIILAGVSASLARPLLAAACSPLSSARRHLRG